MRPQDSYAILGLRPGAGRAEVDQAYRRLIKRYHPDQAGGDVGRAAELNRAYSELRDRTRAPQSPSRQGPRPMPRQLPLRSAPSRGGGALFFIAIVLVAGLAAGAAMMEDRGRLSDDLAARAASAEPRTAAVRASAMSMDEPLATGMIDRAVADAMSAHAAEDPALAAEFSRRCMARLSSSPSVPMFDSCAAFDEAISILTADDPAFESGPFNPSTVTARQVGAGRLLSADYLESESRLQQVRSRVHMQLLPRLPDEAITADELVGSRAP